MCGIVGYVGPKEASPILREGLRQLEYRGYDSAGLALAEGPGLRVLRSVGKLENLERLAAGTPHSGTAGLGHTRWATHGRPSEANAHPHTDCSGLLAVVHNGIIENHGALRAALAARGHRFASETDTEVLAHLIEEGLAADGGLEPEERLLSATRRALAQVRGAYALGVLWSGLAARLVAAKSASPLVIGLGEGETFLASDVPAFLERTRTVLFLEDGELAVVAGAGCRVFGADGRPVERAAVRVSWEAAQARKGDYPHYMLKEIHEQPRALEDTLRGRLEPLAEGGAGGEPGLEEGFLAGVQQVHFVACGTAYHAGLLGRIWAERYAHLPALAETASEYRYRRPVLPPGTLFVAVSQSGETADTLAAVRLARHSGARVLAVCNTVGSALSRQADACLYTRCGPERGVASTKAFTGQLACLALLAARLAVLRGTVDDERLARWARDLRSLPQLLSEALALGPEMLEAARAMAGARSALFLGRTFNQPTALEGALKLKEISYIHAEGYGAGELKHGPIALVDADLPVVVVATDSDVHEKMVSNMEEVRARGGRLIGLCTRGAVPRPGLCEVLVQVPAAPEALSPLVNSVPLQLLAYHAAVLRGRDVDQPRNLAKSVTVE